MMIGSFEVKMIDKSRHKQTIKEYGVSIERSGRKEFLNSFGDIMVTAIARYAPKAGVGAMGGKLATTGFYEMEEDKMTLYLQDYWPYVEFDTVAHVILPKRPGGCLAFPKKGFAITRPGQKLPANQMVFTKKVKHPGTKGQFFIAKSWNRSRILVEKALDKYAKGET